MGLGGLLPVAISMFLIAALGGLAMAIFIFKNKYPPLFLIGAHGFFALGALGLAIWSIGSYVMPSIVMYGTVTIMLAALAGLFLISFQFRDETHPKIIVVLHALVAVTGVSCLFLGFLRSIHSTLLFSWAAH